MANAIEAGVALSLIGRFAVQDEQAQRDLVSPFHTLREDLRTTVKAGSAKASIRKPFNIDVALATVSRILGDRP